MDSEPSVIKLQSAGSEEDSNSISAKSGGETSKNPKLESMRSKIKDSLFKRQLTSKSEAVSLNYIEENNLSPMKQPGPFRRRGTASPNNPKLEKFRNFVKGSLSFVASIASSENQYTESPNVSELGLTPTSRNSFLDDVGQKEGDSTSRSRSEKLGEEEFKESFVDGIEEKVSEEELDEKPSPSKIKHTIFYNNLEDDIQNLKQELEVETDPDIHFIRGNFNDYYEEKEVLGEGTTATVKKCFKKGTENKFAVKIIHYRDDTEMLVLIVQEFKNSRRLNHPHIIRIYELYIDYWSKKIYTVMELAECREMFEVLQDLGHYSEAVASEIFKQILTGINYLHINGVCHRDLKPNNILVSEDGKIVKITDFNVSKFTENKQKKYSSLSTENCKMWTHTGTIAYTAPEVFTDNEYTEAVDMWSAGVVLYTMLCGYQPFFSEYVQELIALISQGKVEFHAEPWDNISDLAKDLVKRCLDVNPKTRYLPSDALMHPWIANHGKVSDQIIYHTQDNLRFYHSTKPRRRPRGCTTINEDVDKVNSVSMVRTRGKRSGTALDSSEIDLFNNKEPPSEEMEVPKSKANKLSPPRIKTSLKNKFKQTPCDQICENEFEETESPVHRKNFLYLLKSVSSPGEKISDMLYPPQDEKEHKYPQTEVKERKISLSEEDSDLDSEEEPAVVETSV